MEELSDTERLIVSYIKSNPPEDCMLDKITRNTSRSRATVLKYLGILHAKGILNYKFVGRSKLWILEDNIREESDYKLEKSQKSETKEEMNDLVVNASKLHKLISTERDLRRSINSPDTVVFTINNNMEIVSTNNTFETYFHGKHSLNEIVAREQMVTFENALKSMDPEDEVMLELDLIEKPGIYRSYKLLLQPISDDRVVVGTTIIGEELSQLGRSKRELETLLNITQATSSAENQEKLLKEVTDGIGNLISIKYCGVFLREGKKLHSVYETEPLFEELPVDIEQFMEGAMDTLETLSIDSQDYSLESVGELKNGSISMVLAVPIIYQEDAMGSILIFSSSTPVSSTSIENVEIAADELAGYIQLQRLAREKEEFTNTLITMNRISNILNSVTNEDEMLERSVTSTIESLGFEMGCIYLTDDEDELTLRVHKNLPSSLRKMCIAGMFTDIFSKTLEEKNVVYITSESDDYESLDPAIANNGIKTLLIIPIKSGDRIMGLVNMGTRQVKTYNQTSLENLSSVGLQLGLALEKTRNAIETKK